MLCHGYNMARFKPDPPILKAFWITELDPLFWWLKNPWNTFFEAYLQKTPKNQNLIQLSVSSGSYSWTSQKKNLNFACFSKNIKSFLKQFAFNTQKIFFSKFNHFTTMNWHKTYDFFEMCELTVLFSKGTKTSAPFLRRKRPLQDHH